jgi:hypothetical protein
MLRETTVVLRKVNRKSWIGIGVLPLAVVLALTAPTYAQSDEKHDEGGCSDATLSGDYAFTIGGEILAVPASAMPPSPGVALAQAGVAMMHFDGTGDFTQVDFTVINGAPSPGATNANGFRNGQTGSYTVNSDCTGSAEIDFPPPPGVSPGQRIHLKFVLADKGKQIHTVVSGLFRPGETEPTPVVIRSDGVKVNHR